MKMLCRKLIAFGVMLVFSFTIIACSTNVQPPEYNPNNQINTPGETGDDTDGDTGNNIPDASGDDMDGNTGNNIPDASGDDTDGNTGNNTPDASGGKDVEYQHYYQNLKSAGFDGDYNVFLSVINNTVPYVMPSDNGYVTVIARAQSPFKSKFHNSNGYIFAAHPIKGYYFAGWEAFNSQGTEINAAQKIYDGGEQFEVQYNVIGDYTGSESIRFVRALFTNDQSKLVNTPSVPFQLTGDESSLLIEPLPAKMAKSTALYQLVEPKEGYYITDWSSFYTSYETMPGYENIIIGGNSVKGGLRDDEYMHLVFAYDERSVYTGRNSSFGIPDKFYITTQRQEDVIPVFVSHSPFLVDYPPEPTEFYFISPYEWSSHSVEFVTRGNGIYLEPRGQYSGDKFYGWYDWDGNLLSTDYVYIDEDFDEDVLYIQYRTGYFDERIYLGGFSEATDYLRFNPIKNGTEWEVAYNHDNDRFIDVLEIPATYKGKPVTRIADRGFAKSWVRDTEYIYQWWFFQSHPLIGRLVVPKTIKEVGDFAFATLHRNVSTSSLTSIDEDTDGDHWTDKHTDITFEVEFLSAQTKVTPYTFSQSANTFIGIKAQLSQILNQLLEIYIDVDSGAGINGEGKLSLNLYPEQFDDENNPWAIYLPESQLVKSRGYAVYALFCEFRHFMQLVATGNVEGASLKTDIGEQYKALVSDNLQNFIPSGNEYNEQFIIKDARAFAYALFGYQVIWTNNLTVSI